MEAVGPGALLFEGTRIAYGRAGLPQGPTVVFTHGAVLDHRVFQAQIAALAPTHRVIWWDLPGHGDSALPRRGFSVASAAACLRALIDQEARARVHLVGQSLGGDITQEFLFRWPERVESAALLGCLPLLEGRSLVQRLQAWVATEKLRWLPLGRFRAAVASSVGHTPAARTYAAACLERMPRAALVATWKAIGGAAHREPGHVFPCPVLLVVGDQDEVGGGIVRQQAAAWAAREPGARLEWIRGAGHIATLDAPELVNRSLTRFFTRPAAR